MTTVRPRVGFVGVGWIGRARLEAVAASGMAEIAAVADLNEAAAQEAAAAVGCPVVLGAMEDVLVADLDAVVLATPSALHAAQATAALGAGLAVFCQKPLARTADEARAVVAAAREADRLLGIDLSYRHVAGVPVMRELVRSGELGDIFAADLRFHNAYGPDKAWFFDRELSGGGCVIDLGIHLVDLALWAMDFPEVIDVSARLFAEGRPVGRNSTRVEDYAVARLDTAAGSISLACSWHLAAGRDAVIGAGFFGTRGGVALRNVGGSFFDFQVERFDGRVTSTISEPPDVWGGRAVVEWTRRLAAGAGYEASCEQQVQVAAVLDRIYERGLCASS